MGINLNFMSIYSSKVLKLVSRKLAHNIKHKLTAQACCDNKRLTVTA